MTAPNIVADPPGARERCNRLFTLVAAVAADCERLLVAPIDLNVRFTSGVQSVLVGLPTADTASVDALAGAYGLGPRDPAALMYCRTGSVLIEGGPVAVTVYCAYPDMQPAVRAGVVVATTPALPVARPVRVDAERTDGGAA